MTINLLINRGWQVQQRITDENLYTYQNRYHNFL